jgi:hypothetical protein
VTDSAFPIPVPIPLKPETRAKLMGVSTATLCTALYKRGFRNQTLQGVLPVNTDLQRKQPNMVGPAFTLRYIPAREDLNPITVFQNRDHPQRVAIEQCPSGAVMVFDSRGDARAASAGGILISRLHARGCAQTVAFAIHPKSLQWNSARITKGRVRRPISPCIKRWISTCPSAAAPYPCGRAT